MELVEERLPFLEEALNVIRSEPSKPLQVRYDLVPASLQSPDARQEIWKLLSCVHSFYRLLLQGCVRYVLDDDPIRSRMGGFRIRQVPPLRHCLIHRPHRHPQEIPQSHSDEDAGDGQQPQGDIAGSV